MPEAEQPGPKDVFLHLLLMVTFYISVIAFLVLMFQLINLSFIDPVESSIYSFRSAFQGLRWGIAFLIVVFPIYFFLTRHLRAVYASDEVRRDMRTRKWLTYFTLFAAAVTFIITLVTLLFRFLDDALTVRFVLKVLTVSFVAIVSYWYYQQELADPAKLRFQAAIYGIVLMLAVAAGYALYLATSPEARQINKFNEDTGRIPIRALEKPVILEETE